MFQLTNDILAITLPEGQTQVEILESAKAEFSDLETLMYGKDIKVNGRLTTSLAMWLGHKLAHISKTVSLFDPKENGFVSVIRH